MRSAEILSNPGFLRIISLSRRSIRNTPASSSKKDEGTSNNDSTVNSTAITIEKGGQEQVNRNQEQVKDNLESLYYLSFRKA